MIRGSGDSPGGHGNPLQYSCLESPHGRSLAGYGPWGHKESDRTEINTFTFKLLHEGLLFNPWVRKIPWRRKWQPTPVFLPGKSYRQRSLVGYSPWGYKELNMTEPLSMHAVGFVEIKDGDVKAN